MFHCTMDSGSPGSFPVVTGDSGDSTQDLLHAGRCPPELNTTTLGDTYHNAHVKEAGIVNLNPIKLHLAFTSGVQALLMSSSHLDHVIPTLPFFQRYLPLQLICPIIKTDCSQVSCIAIWQWGHQMFTVKYILGAEILLLP